MKTNQHPLVDELRTRNGQLAAGALECIERAKDILQYAAASFPTGTDHSASHTCAVERIAFQLTKPLLPHLKDHEIYFLALACHYHDLGMVGTEELNATAEGREQIRREHAEIIGEKLQMHWADLGFPDQDTAAALSEICRGHRPVTVDGFANWNDTTARRVLGTDLIRTRLLCAAIYAADELHIGADRASELISSWVELTSKTSRVHWERHQLIQGPAVDGKSLVFKIACSTPEQADDIRRNVLRKAFAAVEALRGQIAAHSLKANVPLLEVDWDYVEMFKLLSIVAMSDLVPRTLAEIEGEVWRLYHMHAANFTSIQEFATEHNSSESDVRRAIQRAAQTLRRLQVFSLTAKSRDKLGLSLSPLAWEKIERLCNLADKANLHLSPSDSSRYFVQIYQSAFGREYVKQQIMPTVAERYSVMLQGNSLSNSLKCLVQQSTRAFKIVNYSHPKPTGIVKISALECAILAGTILDVFENPNLLVNRELRHALRCVYREFANDIPGQLYLLEELAIVGGYTLAELYDQIPIQGEDAQLAGDAVKISLKQEVNVDDQGASHAFPYWIVAGIRSGEPVRMLVGEQQPVQVSITETLVAKKIEGTGTAMIEMKSQIGTNLANGRIPCHIKINVTERKVTLQAHKFNTADAEACPFFVSIRETAITFSPRLPCVQADDLQEIKKVKHFEPGDKLALELQHVDQYFRFGTIVSKTLASIWEFFDFPDEFAQRFAALDREQFLPYYASFDVERFVLETSTAEVAPTMQEMLKRAAEDKPTVTTVYLRSSLDAEIYYDESFCGYFPEKFWPVPKIKSDSLSQEEFEKVWYARSEEVKLTAFFTADIPTLTSNLREWFETKSGPFPINMSGEPFEGPHIRSVVEVLFRPRADRVWYWDLPVVFLVRAANRTEKYQQEAEFWRKRGDVPRAELAEEHIPNMNPYREDITKVCTAKKIDGQGEFKAP